MLTEKLDAGNLSSLPTFSSRDPTLTPLEICATCVQMTSTLWHYYQVLLRCVKRTFAGELVESQQLEKYSISKEVTNARKIDVVHVHVIDIIRCDIVGLRKSQWFTLQSCSK